MYDLWHEVGMSEIEEQLFAYMCIAFSRTRDLQKLRVNSFKNRLNR